MRKIISLLIVMGLLISVNLLSPANIYANTPTSINEVQKEREQLNDKLSKKEAEIVEVLNEIESLHTEIAKIEAELVANKNKTNETEAKIAEYESEFYQLLDEVNEINDTISQREEILAKRMAAYQEMGGDVSYLEVIFNAKSFTEFISRVTSVATMTNADQTLIKEQIADREQVEKYQDEILDKITEQEKLIEELAEIEASINLQQVSITESKKSLEKKEAKLSKEKAKIVNEDNDLKNLEETYRKRIEEAAQKKQNEEKQNNETKAKTRSIGKKTSAESKPVVKDETTRKEDNAANKTPKKKPETVGKTLRMESTAYGPDCVGCSGYTATGMWVGGKITPKVVAVDPSVIPLGTRVWVEGYGEAIAADTGGAIKGNRIDVLVKSEAYAAKNWGRKMVTVKILD